MLKYLNSSYRCLWLTCETFNTFSINVNTLKSVNCRRNTSRTIHFTKTASVSYYYESNQDFDSMSTKEKNINHLNELQASEPKNKKYNKQNQMSDSFQPHTSYVSNGGEFQM